MNDNHQEKEFVSQVKKILDSSIENLDAGTLSRLTQARNKSLESLKGKMRKPYYWMTASAAGLLAAGLIMFVTMFPFNKAEKTKIETAIEHFEMVTTTEHFDLFENLDFYIWLEVEKKNDSI